MSWSTHNGLFPGGSSRREIARPSPAPCHSRHGRGFTLIEVLVVIVIIGLTLSFAVLTIGSNEDEVAQTEARRFAALVRLASEEAVLRSQEMAVELQRSGYTFVTQGSTGWVPLEKDDEVFRTRELPPDVTLSGDLNGEPVPFELLEEGETPRIYLLSSGEMTPFEVEFKLDFGAAFAVSGDFTGKVTLQGKRQ